MSESFIRRHRRDWERFDKILRVMENRGPRFLTKEEIRTVGPLYRKICTDLSFVQAQNYDSEVVSYLNDLAGRGYNQIYQPEKSSLLHLFCSDLPKALQKNSRYIFWAVMLIITGIILGYAITSWAPLISDEIFPKVVGEKLIERFKNDQWFNNSLEQRPVVAMLLMQNNIGVAINAFALGIFAGIFTFWVLLSNSLLLGYLAAVFTRQGYALSYWAAILPHGIIELTAIALAGAAGWVLGMALLFPGELKRGDNLRLKSREAVLIFLSSVILLVIAGLIEGLISTIPTKIIPDGERLVFAGLTVVFLWWLGRKTGLFRSKTAPSDQGTW